MNWGMLIWAIVFAAVGVLIGWSTRDWRDDDEKIEWLNLELGRMEERLDEAHATLERLRDVAAEHLVDDEPVYRPYVAGDDPRFRLDPGRDLTGDRYYCQRCGDSMLDKFRPFHERVCSTFGTAEPVTDTMSSDGYEWTAAEENASFLEDDTRHRRAQP